MKTVTETCDATSGPCAGEITKMKNAAAALRAKLDQATSAGAKPTTAGADPAKLAAAAKANADATAGAGAGAGAPTAAAPAPATAPAPAAGATAAQ